MLIPAMWACQDDADSPNIAENPPTVTNVADYQFAIDASAETLMNESVAKNASVKKFWEEKRSEQLNNFLYKQKLAETAIEHYELTGDIGQLAIADDYLQKALTFAPAPAQEPLFQLRSSNAVQRHDFQTAKTSAEQALSVTGNPYSSRLLLVDAIFETQGLRPALDEFEKIEETQGIGYHIRLARIYDAQGKLDQAIETMERIVPAIPEDQKVLFVWAHSNLGDFYGHNNEVEKSYEQYLMALKVSPLSFHALKGIAWINFSGERNADKAEAIADHLLKVRSEDPGMLLMKADLAEYRGDSQSAESFMQQFADLVSQEKYGDTYNHDLVKYWLSKPNTQDKALQLAEHERSLRDLPDVEALLAYAQYINGQNDTAKKTALDLLDEDGLPPDSQFLVAKILLNTGEEGEGRALLKELQGAVYELGPNAEKEINQLLGE